MAEKKTVDCSDCRDDGISRRDFVRRVGGTAIVGGLLPVIGSSRAVAKDVGPTPKSAAETAVKRFYDSLKSEQKKVICFDFNHDLRKKINANWAITKPTIGEYTKEQQALISEILKGVTSPDGYERFLKQMEDDHGGIESYSVAVFGEPGTDQFEFEMTGRHLTIRADGNSVPGAAFGGPIVYGHGEGDSKKGLPGNVFYYQTKKANEVFKALDGKQREAALLPKAPPEAAVKLQGAGAKFPGVRLGDLSGDQKELVESVIKVILAPYRDEDVAEAVSIMKESGGLDAHHMAFYASDDLGGDHEWDIWRLEGPNFVWHFRGAPHVHAYVNVARTS